MNFTKIGKKGFGWVFNTYRLDEETTIQTLITGLTVGRQGLYRLEKSGLIGVEKGFVWDGPSGPTVDTPSSMVASLAHDILYDMIREKLIAPSYRQRADAELYRICVKHGMWRIRAWSWYWSLRAFGGRAARA